jgi:hypothetical protein
LIPPNTPVATLLNKKIYVRIYIPKRDFPGASRPAEITVDSVSKQIFDGVVEQINQQQFAAQCADREERVPGVRREDSHRR